MTKLNKCRNCGSDAERFTPKNGGVGVRCTGCASQLSHPDYTWEQIDRCWNYRNSDSFSEE